MALWPVRCHPLSMLKAHWEEMSDTVLSRSPTLLTCDAEDYKWVPASGRTWESVSKAVLYEATCSSSGPVNLYFVQRCAGQSEESKAKEYWKNVSSCPCPKWIKSQRIWKWRSYTPTDHLDQHYWVFWLVPSLCSIIADGRGPSRWSSCLSSMSYSWLLLTVP